MSAVVGSFVTGMLILSCSVQEVDPRTHQQSETPMTFLYLGRDGRGVMTGWPRVTSRGMIEARISSEGVIRLTGGAINDSGAETWAQLRRVPESGDFDMEWLMIDSFAQDGNASIAVWAKGRCQQSEARKDAKP